MLSLVYRLKIGLKLFLSKPGPGEFRPWFRCRLFLKLRTEYNCGTRTTINKTTSIASHLVLTQDRILLDEDAILKLYSASDHLFTGRGLLATKTAELGEKQAAFSLI